MYDRIISGGFALMTIGCQLQSQDKNSANNSDTPSYFLPSAVLFDFYPLPPLILLLSIYLTTLFSDSLPCPMLLVFFHRAICPMKPIIIY